MHGVLLQVRTGWERTVHHANFEDQLAVLCYLTSAVTKITDMMGLGIAIVDGRSDVRVDGEVTPPYRIELAERLEVKRLSKPFFRSF